MWNGGCYHLTGGLKPDLLSPRRSVSQSHIRHSGAAENSAEQHFQGENKDEKETKRGEDGMVEEFDRRVMGRKDMFGEGSTENERMQWKG